MPKTKCFKSKIRSCFNRCSLVQHLFSENSMRDGILISSKLESISFPSTPDQLYQELKHRPYWTMSIKLISIFCDAALNNFENAWESLDTFEEKYVVFAEKYKFISTDDADKFRNYADGLEASVLYISPHTEEVYNRLNELLSRNNGRKYTKLKSDIHNGVGAIFAWLKTGTVKFALSRLQSNRDRKPDLVTAEWNLLLIMILRSERLKTQAGPFKLETQIIKECVRYRKNRVLVDLAISIHVADLLKHEQWNPQRGPLVLSEECVFRDFQAVKNHAELTAEDIIREFGHSAELLLDVADLLLGSLPVECRNPELGKRCLTLSLRQDPNRSNANYRMALYLTRYEKKFDEALTYAQAAYTDDPGNRPALMDLLSLLLRDPYWHKEELENMFDRLCCSETPPPFTYVLQGLYLFMTGKRKDCLGNFLAAHQLDPEFLNCLTALPWHIQCYGWDMRLIDPWDLHELLLNSLDQPNLTNEELECLRKAIFAVYNGIMQRQTSALR